MSAWRENVLQPARWLPSARTGPVSGPESRLLAGRAPGCGRSGDGDGRGTLPRRPAASPGTVRWGFVGGSSALFEQGALDLSVERFGIDRSRQGLALSVDGVRILCLSEYKLAGRPWLYEIASQTVHICLGRFGGIEFRLGDLAGGIVDKGNQGTMRASSLEPVVRRSRSGLTRPATRATFP